MALDIKSVFDDGQAHVMLSRAQELNQIYILDELPEGKIRASTKALAENEAMNNRSINNNPMPWDQNDEKFIKIGALNCMNLTHNYEDLLRDKTIMKSSIIALSETWLEVNESLAIDGYKAHFNSNGPGKGLALYWKDGKFKPTVDIKEDKMQITKIESSELQVIVVYRSEQGSTLKLIEHLETMIEDKIATVICGDFNICFKTNRNNRVTKFIETKGFQQLMQEPTHIKGRNIDHFYFRSGGQIQEDAHIYRYSPYYTDHDALCATIEWKGLVPL